MNKKEIKTTHASPTTEDIEKLNDTLVRLIVERDNLKFVVCKNIEAKYMAKLGDMEYRTYEAECLCRRLRRKAELIRIRKNRKEKIADDEIEATLDFEMEEYEEELRGKFDALATALERARVKPMAEKDANLHKRLYRDIMRALHPDLNPSASEKEQKLFLLAQEAYKSGDLEAMKIIHSVACHNMNAETAGDGSEDIEQEYERLLLSAENLKSEIKTIKQTHPYTLKKYLFNETKLAERKAQLKEELFNLQLAIEAYQEEIKLLMEEVMWETIS